MLKIDGAPADAQTPDGSDTAISDVSIAHRMPKDTCSDRCQAGAVTFGDDTGPAEEWITCELSLALAQGDLAKILEIREKIKTAQKGTGEKNPPKCPVLGYADNLAASISAKIAQALSSGQIPEAFRTED